MIRIKGRGCTSYVVMWAAAFAAGVGAAAFGQQPSGQFNATVQLVDGHAEQIELAVNKSAMIDCAEPVQAATVVNPEIAEVNIISPKVIIVRAKSFGITQLVLIARDGRKRAYQISVGMDAAQLEAAIRTAVPLAKVRVRAVMDTIILSGVVPDAQAAEQIVELANIFSPKVQNHMRVAGTQQVLLRCTVAEVNRSAIRQLGFNGFSFGEDFFGVNNLDQISPASIGVPELMPVSTPPIRPPQRFRFTGGDFVVGPQTTIYFGLPRAQTEIFLQAMRENGLLRVLAEPNLVAISGQTASFLAGGEFPVPVPQDQNTITIEWREFGVRLKFTPAVVPGQRIRLKVAPEVSELDFSSAVQLQAFVIPGLTNRKAETVIEVANGQTFAIAGLLSEQVRGISRRIPGLGDLPILGALFSSVQYRKSQTELLILVTPELVSPMDPQQVPPVPGQEMTDPTDFELFTLGLLEGQAPPKPAPEAPASQPAATASAEPAYSAGLYGPWGPADFEEAD